MSRRDNLFLANIDQSIMRALAALVTRVENAARHTNPVHSLENEE